MLDNDIRIKESYLYESLPDNKVKCTVCNRYCILDEGEVGFCKTRKNIGGKLYTLSYADISSYNLNPIEQKPAYHYYPTTSALTLGSWGCNFHCPWCNNFDISMRGPPDDAKNASILSLSLSKMMDIINSAPEIQGVSFSNNEPTLSLEYIIDVFKGIDPSFYRHIVTNGYMTMEALELLIDAGMDGMTVSIFGPSTIIDNKLNIDSEKIWQNIIYSFKKGVHIEIVYLLIPNFNDSKEAIKTIVRKIKNNLSKETPLHFVRYYPSYLFQGEETPITLLQEAHTIAKREGLSFVYIGNANAHPLQSTYCPNCAELLIKRDNNTVTFTNLTIDNSCPNCGYKLPIYPYRTIK